MKYVILRLNKRLFSVPINGVGVFSVYSNKYGSILECSIWDELQGAIIREEKQLLSEQILNFQLMSLDSDINYNMISSYSSTGLSNSSNSSDDQKKMQRIVFEINGNAIFLPYIKHGTLSAIITIFKGHATVDIREVTENLLISDYYQSIMNLKDELTICLK